LLLQYLQLFHKASSGEKICFAISCGWCSCCSFYEIF